MDANTQLNESEERIPDGGREARGFRAFMKRPATLISTAAMVAGAVLGVVVLGDLSSTENTTTAATTTISDSNAKITGDKIAGE